MSFETLIPKPVKLAPKDGVFTLAADTAIVARGSATAIGHTLAQALAPATGYWPAVTPSHSGANAVVIELAPDLARLGPEGYQLNVTPQAVTLRAPQPAGLFYGTQSLLQLLPPEILLRISAADLRASDGKSTTCPGGALEWSIPALG